MPGSRHFFVTDNSEEVLLDGTKWERFAVEHCERFAGQEERGAEGRRHFQIYFQVKGRKTFEWIHKTLGIDNAWIKNCESAPKSWDYCTKSDSRVDGGWSFILGERPGGQGSRSDLSDLKRALDSGGMGEAFDSNFSSAVKYTRGCQEYLKLKLGGHRRDSKTTVWVFVGEAGCGKSSLAHALAAHFGLELYVKPCSEKWFDHYDPLVHKAVLLDDFTGWIPFNQLLAVMDRGQCFVEQKGTTVPFLAEHLFITSNVPWEKWYDWEKKSKEALRRRIDYEWLGNFQVNYVNVGNGVQLGEPAQGPKCPVIEGGHLGFTPLYHGKGKWELDEIEIVED